MPVVSDPGHRLVTLCLRHHIPVVPIPGPSAFIAALAASGLPTEEFLFVGFLPSRAGARRKALDALKAEPRVIVLYEAPHRLVETLADAAEILGARPAVVAREITKIHEEFLRGNLNGGDRGSRDISQTKSAATGGGIRTRPQGRSQAGCAGTRVGEARGL
jgi:16S rRNA (cytidine1402-2'-O)-methyltransferase